MQPLVLKNYPHLKDSYPFTPLIKKPTPYHLLGSVGERWGIKNLSVKREDKTHALYGGNKVRNLEFVLADASQKGFTDAVTVVPYGSNFTAALSAHAPSLGIKVHLSQFIAKKNDQIEEHVNFCHRNNACIQNYEGTTGPIRAGYRATHQKLVSKFKGEKVYWITPGASSLQGAMGHLNAVFELNAQLKEKGELPPDYIVVGSGTLGTTAGLITGAHLLGWKTKVIGVRCAESIVCNKYRVRIFVNRLLNEFGRAGEYPSFELVDTPTRVPYAVACEASFEVMGELWENESLSLDTTYTSKAMLYLKHAAQCGRFKGSSVLYWHTYSPAAKEWNAQEIQNELKRRAQDA